MTDNAQPTVIASACCRAGVAICYHNGRRWYECVACDEECEVVDVPLDQSPYVRQCEQNHAKQAQP